MTIDKVGMSTDRMGNGRFPFGSHPTNPYTCDHAGLNRTAGLLEIHCVMNPLNNIVTANDL